MAETRYAVFRPAPWLIAIVAAGTAISATGLIWLGRKHGVTLLTVSLGLVTAFFLAGLLDYLISRIELTQDALRIVELHRRRSVARREIESVKTDGGLVVLKLRDGSWFKLPDTGRDSIEVLNTIRAWLTWSAVAR